VPARRPRTVNDVSTYHVTSAAGVTDAALEDRFLAVNDRHVGQRQLEDEPTHHLDVFVGDLLGYGLFHDGVLAHDMSLNVRPSDECLRRLSGLRNGELLDMGQRTGRRRFYLLNAVYSLVEPVPLDDGRLVGRLKRC